MSRRLPDTPSSGKREVLAALLRAGAHGDRWVTAARLRRHFGPRVTTDEITTALNLAWDDDATVARDGENYQLSDSGLVAARTHPNSRYLTVS